jgi:EAL domain-containing protein (putative c-di-GMP-specific phosphodiesterase class I)
MNAPIQKSSHGHTTFPYGATIMRQGETGDCAYIIEGGAVEILIERPDGKVQNVGTRGAGTIIGEMALVDAGLRTATVRALQDCTMVKVTREDFVQRLHTTDPVIQMITQVILTRFRDTLTRAEILGESATYPPIESLERHVAGHTDAVESLKIASEFKAALENRELELHYQPIVELGGGIVVGFEALMRWTHPEKGFVSPGVFIPIAEKSGLIVEASKWALDEASAALKRIGQAVGRSDLMMSVNFSSHDFAQESFVKGVVDTVAKHTLKPPQIKLEITERLLIQQPDNAKAALEACRDHGIGIAIDDFGTGYSSLSYLYYFPIDTLKIDQSFVRSMTKDKRSAELVKSIIGLGKNIGMTIVAEGVEGLAEATMLREMGCDCAQGYYFAKPVAEKIVIEKLMNWNVVGL